MNLPEFVKKNQESILLIVILAVAAVLRFACLDYTSLSNDELSSIIRTQYSSFHELYDKGIKTDVHPAGLQIFLYYWLKIAGTSPFAVRFPFALFGLLSVLFSYLIAKRWFHSLPAISVSATMAALQFPLLYSQVARMYSLGLFFCLLNIWSWNKILFPNENEERKRILHSSIYILSALLAMYLHYFSFMFVGIVGMTGFLFLNKKTVIPYFTSWILIILFYLPAIPLFLQQLRMGGLEDWLAEPGSNTIMRYLFYCFNNSEILTSIFFSVPVLCIIILGRNVKFTRFQFISLAWFLIPYAIAYYYSIYRQPVLQYSGLLFSFPMLLIFIFSFLPERKISNLITVIILFFFCGITVSTVAENKYYTTPHFGVFKELAENTIQWEKKYGKENITKVFTLISPKYLSYYFDRMNTPTSADLNLVNERNQLGTLEQILDTCQSKYFLYGWSNSRHYYETLELITAKYPVVAERDTFFNSEITLFKRSEKSNDTISFQASDKFVEPAVLTEKQKEFKVILYKELNDLNLQDDNMVTAEVQINSPDSLNDVELVITYESYGENIGWSGIPVKYFFTSPGKWQRVILCAKVPDERNSTLKIFIWNPSKRNFELGDYTVKIKKKNPLYRII